MGRSIQTQAEDFPRALKVVTVADQALCNVKYYLRAVPPEDMLQAKELYTEILVKFDSSVAPANRVLSRLTVNSAPPDFYLDDPDVMNEVDGTFEADDQGILRVSMDLTPYMVSRTGDNWVGFTVPVGSGTILMWRVELVHTTEGVRTRQS